MVRQVLLDKNDIMEKAMKSSKIIPEVKKMRDVAYQRIKQLMNVQSKTGGRNYSRALENLGGDVSFKLSPKNKNYLQEIDRLMKFIDDSSSTLSGLKHDIVSMGGKDKGKPVKWTEITEFVEEINKKKWQLESELFQYLKSGSNFLSSLGSAERQSTVDNFLKQVPLSNSGTELEDLLLYMGQQERAEETARQLKGKGTFIIPD